MQKKQIGRLKKGSTSHLPGYPWPPEEKYWDVRDAYGNFPEELVEAFNEDFAGIRKVFADSIAPWNPQPLWPDGAPYFEARYGQPQPSVALRVHENGGDLPTVLVCPGGAFLWKASYEGMPVAEKFYEMGFNAAVLDYRVAAYPRDISQLDAKRAIRYLRAHADRLGIHPNKIVILGFSAGGILSALTGTIFDAGDPNAEDPVERVSCRPDAVVPCYGAMSSVQFPKEGLSHNRVMQQYFARRSPDANVSVDTPPFYIWQCGDMDDPRGALNLGERLTVCGVPFEMHLFPDGVHGTALCDGGSPTEGSNDPHAAHWVELCAEWIDAELNRERPPLDRFHTNPTLNQLSGFPWPDDARYMNAVDEFGNFPEDLLPDLKRDLTKVRTLFNESIAPWNPQPLWPDGAPGFKEKWGHPQPSVAVKIHPDARDRGLVLVCPGGGFVWKAPYEGMPVAEKFYEMGFHAAVLDYRVAPYHISVSKADGQRAIRWLRANAERLGFSPDKIAILGFSAGGMLANMVGADFTDGDPAAADPVERESSRPDAVIPCYGAFSKVAFPASKALQHNRDAQNFNAQFSGDACITRDTPPYFIWQCGEMDDPRNALHLGEELTYYGIPFELHLFPYGAHGIALSDGNNFTMTGDDPHAGHWVELCAEWLRGIDF